MAEGKHTEQSDSNVQLMDELPLTRHTCQSQVLISAVTQWSPGGPELTQHTNASVNFQLQVKKRRKHTKIVALWSLL